MSELERNPEFPASPRHEALAPAPTQEESREAPHNTKRVLTSKKQEERLSQVPVATRGNPNFLPHLKRRPVLPWNSRGTPEVVAQFEKTLMSPSTQDKA